MTDSNQKVERQAVGIDFGTTYSSISYLNKHGQPIVIPNEEGELSTPSALMFKEDGSIIVGRQALENAIQCSDRVVLYPKRDIGKEKKKWYLNGQPYSPVDLAAIIIQKLLKQAEKKLGKIEEAVITVPAQFSEIQRQEVAEAGSQAGLKKVDLINEPVAAALCYVLGEEGLWFSELTEEQRILVFDLGGGTFDLSIVKYSQNEVNVIGGGGHLNLGGLDWNHQVERFVCDKYSRLVDEDVSADNEFLQKMILEVEKAKRTLSKQDTADLKFQYENKKKLFQLKRNQFEGLTEPLVEKTCELTTALLKKHKMGWAHIDAVLLVGGASRMPMIRRSVKELSGRTLNSTLSPDQSIAHGAAYYSGMLISNNKFAKSIFASPTKKRLSKMTQRSVSARSLGIMVRTQENEGRVPHYLISANTSLPAQVSQVFETVRDNQQEIKVPIIESGTQTDTSLIHLGDCRIDNLPENLPEGTEVLVTMKYDHSARLDVSAKILETRKEARTSLHRNNNVVQKLEFSAPLLKGKLNQAESEEENASRGKSDGVRLKRTRLPQVPSFQPSKRRPSNEKLDPFTEAIIAAEKVVDKKDPEVSKYNIMSSVMPVPLCESCLEPFDADGICTKCGCPMLVAKEFAVPKSLVKKSKKIKVKKSVRAKKRS